MTRSRIIGVLVLLSALNLAVMVPGGFVETRVFPSYSVSVLTTFNVFLTILGLGSLLLAYLALRHGKTGLLPLIAGLSFVAVYVVDLLHIFPVSQTPMSVMLISLECIGTLLGVALIFASISAVSAAPHSDGALAGRVSLRLFTILAIIGLGIVVFATLAAS